MELMLNLLRSVKTLDISDGIESLRHVLQSAANALPAASENTPVSVKNALSNPVNSQERALPNISWGFESTTPTQSENAEQPMIRQTSLFAEVIQEQQHKASASDSDSLDVIFPKPIIDFFGDERPLPTAAQATLIRKPVDTSQVIQAEEVTPVEIVPPVEAEIIQQEPVSICETQIVRNVEEPAQTSKPVEVLKYTPEPVAEDFGFVHMVRRNQFLSNSIKRLADQYFEHSEKEEQDRAQDPVLRQALQDAKQARRPMPVHYSVPVPPAMPKATSSWAETIEKSFQEESPILGTEHLATSLVATRPIYYP